MKPFLLKKDHPDLPDHYGIKIEYQVGGSEEIEAAAHYFLTDIRIMRIVTHDDIWEEIPLDSIKKTKYDKRYSKKIAIQEEINRKKLEELKKKEGENGSL